MNLLFASFFFVILILGHCNTPVTIDSVSGLNSTYPYLGTVTLTLEGEVSGTVASVVFSLNNCASDCSSNSPQPIVDESDPRTYTVTDLNLYVIPANYYVCLCDDSNTALASGVWDNTSMNRTLPSTPSVSTNASRDKYTFTFDSGKEPRALMYAKPRVGFASVYETCSSITLTELQSSEISTNSWNVTLKTSMGGYLKPCYSFCPECDIQTVLFDATTNVKQNSLNMQCVDWINDTSFITGSTSGTVAIWDSTTITPTRFYSVGENDVEQIVVNTDSTAAAAVDKGKKITVNNIENGALLSNYIVSTSNTIAITWISSRNMIYGHDHVLSATMVDEASETEYSISVDEDVYITAISALPSDPEDDSDADTVAVGFSDGSVMIYNLSDSTTTEIVTASDCSEPAVTSIVYSSDAVAATRCTNGVVLYDISKSILTSRETAYKATRMTMSSNGAIVVIDTDESSYYVYNRQNFVGNSYFSFNANAGSISSSGEVIVLVGSGGTVHVISNVGLGGQFFEDFYGLADRYIYSVKPYEDFYAVSTFDSAEENRGPLQIFNYDGELITRFWDGAVADQRILDFDFNSDRSRVVTCHINLCALWTITGELVNTTPTDGILDMKQANRVTFQPGDDSLVTVANSSLIAQYDITNNWTPKWAFANDSSITSYLNIHLLEYTKDGNHLIMVHRNGIRVYDTDTWSRKYESARTDTTKYIYHAQLVPNYNSNASSDSLTGNYLYVVEARRFFFLDLNTFTEVDSVDLYNDYPSMFSTFTSERINDTHIGMRDSNGYYDLIFFTTYSSKSVGVYSLSQGKLLASSIEGMADNMIDFNFECSTCRVFFSDYLNDPSKMFVHSYSYFDQQIQPTQFYYNSDQFGAVTNVSSGTSISSIVGTSDGYLGMVLSSGVFLIMNTSTNGVVSHASNESGLFFNSSIENDNMGHFVVPDDEGISFYDPYTGNLDKSLVINNVKKIRWSPSGEYFAVLIDNSSATSPSSTWVVSVYSSKTSNDLIGSVNIDAQTSHDSVSLAFSSPTKASTLLMITIPSGVVLYDFDANTKSTIDMTSVVTSGTTLTSGTISQEGSYVVVATSAGNLYTVDSSTGTVITQKAMNSTLSSYDREILKVEFADRYTSIYVFTSSNYVSSATISDSGDRIDQIDMVFSGIYDYGKGESQYYVSTENGLIALANGMYYNTMKTLTTYVSPVVGEMKTDVAGDLEFSFEIAPPTVDLSVHPYLLYITQNTEISPNITSDDAQTSSSSYEFSLSGIPNGTYNVEFFFYDLTYAKYLSIQTEISFVGITYPAVSEVTFDVTDNQKATDLVVKFESALATSISPQMALTPDGTCEGVGEEDYYEAMQTNGKIIWTSSIQPPFNGSPLYGCWRNIEGVVGHHISEYPLVSSLLSISGMDENYPFLDITTLNFDLVPTNLYSVVLIHSSETCPACTETSKYFFVDYSQDSENNLKITTSKSLDLYILPNNDYELCMCDDAENLIGDSVVKSRTWNSGSFSQSFSFVPEVSFDANNSNLVFSWERDPVSTTHVIPQVSVMMSLEEKCSTEFSSPSINEDGNWLISVSGTPGRYSICYRFNDYDEAKQISLDVEPSVTLVGQVYSPDGNASNVVDVEVKFISSPPDPLDSHPFYAYLSFSSSCPDFDTSIFTKQTSESGNKFRFYGLEERVYIMCYYWYNSSQYSTIPTYSTMKKAVSITGVDIPTVSSVAYDPTGPLLSFEFTTTELVSLPRVVSSRQVAAVLKDTDCADGVYYDATQDGTKWTAAGFDFRSFAFGQYNFCWRVSSDFDGNITKTNNIDINPSVSLHESNGVHYISGNYYHEGTVYLSVPENCTFDSTGTSKSNSMKVEGQPKTFYLQTDPTNTSIPTPNMEVEVHCKYGVELPITFVLMFEPSGISTQQASLVLPATTETSRSLSQILTKAGLLTVDNTLKAKLSNNPEMVGSASVVLIVLAVVFVFWRRRRARAKGKVAEKIGFMPITGSDSIYGSVRDSFGTLGSNLSYQTSGGVELNGKDISTTKRSELIGVHFDEEY